MIGRRALMTRILGAAAAAQVATPAQVIKAAGLGPSPAALGALAQPVGSPTGAVNSLMEPWKFAEALRMAYYNQTVGADTRMHHSIATKRSWSQAYKQHWHGREMEELARVEEILRQDDAFRDRLMKLAGLT